MKKNKGGRPRTVNGDIRWTLRCSAQFLKKLDRVAKAEKVSRAQVIRRLVEDAESKL